MKSVLTAAALALLLAMPTARAEEWRWGEIVREELFATYFPECPDADAVVLLDHGVARVDDKFRLKFQRHGRTKIMTENGLDRAVVRIPYSAGDEIKNFRAQTIVPPGNVLKVEKQHIREEASGTDKVMVVTFPGVQKGAVLEWEYELRSDRIDALPEWAFQGRDPVRVSRFELQVRPGTSYEATFPWAPGMMPAPVKTRVNDPSNPSRELEQAAWEQRNQPPVQELPFVPYPQEYVLTLHVQLGGFEAGSLRPLEVVEKEAAGVKVAPTDRDIKRSWGTVAEELASHVERALADAAGVREWAAKDAAVAAAADPAARARALFTRVRDGLGTDAPRDGAAPAAPSAVVAAGHGTVTEKNLVLLALLRAESIPADPVYVRTRRRGLFEERRTDPRQLDRVIVRTSAGGSPVWLDAASHCPFGVLAPEARVAKGVLARAPGGTLVDITAPEPETSRTVVTNAAVDRNGTLEATSTLTLAGDRAMAARGALARGGDVAWAESLIRERFGKDASLVSAKVQGAADCAAPLAVEMTYRVPAYAKSEGERMRCPTPFLERADAAPLPEGERYLPAELPYAGPSREDVTVKLPEGFVLEGVPAQATSRGADFSAKITHTAGQGSYTASRDVTVREPLVQPRDLDRLRSFLAAVAAGDREESVLRASTLRSAAR